MLTAVARDERVRAEKMRGKRGGNHDDDHHENRMSCSSILI